MIINVDKLTDKISNNLEYIELLLTELGYDNLVYRHSENSFRFARIGGDNTTAMRFNCETLNFVCYTDNSKGNIYTLVMDLENLNFPKALEWVSAKLGFSRIELHQKVKLPFGGFYRNVIKQETEPEIVMNTYHDSVFHEYQNQYSYMWFLDGISYESQRKFNIGYDHVSSSILIPEYTFDGKLCGIQARVNQSDCDHNRRWWAFLPCSRNLTLYGYHINYKAIKEKSICFLLESEKGVMQLDTFGCDLGLGVCGHSISYVQAKYIKSLMIDEVILAFDEGLEEYEILEQAEKLVIDNKIFKNKVGYIFDRTNKYLPKGSKASPSDLGKEIFDKLCSECVVWL